MGDILLAQMHTLELSEIVTALLAALLPQPVPTLEGSHLHDTKRRHVHLITLPHQEDAEMAYPSHSACVRPHVSACVLVQVEKLTLPQFNLALLVSQPCRIIRLISILQIPIVVHYHIEKTGTGQHA